MTRSEALLVRADALAALGAPRTATALDLRNTMARWYAHGRMKQVAGWFVQSGAVPQEIKDLLGYTRATPTGFVPIELAQVARAFRDLQEARHRADYDVRARHTRSEARERVDQARRASADWQRISASPTARMFLVLLLTGTAPIQAR